MDDLISRAGAIDALTNTNLKRNVDSVRDGDMNRTRRAAQRVIAQLPTVDAMPVVYARWKDNGNGTVSCSRCATWFQKEREPYLRYCGWCGAKMDDERRGEDAAD